MAGMELDEWADRIDAVSQGYAEYYGIERSAQWALLKLTEELGELTQAHLTVTGQSRPREADGDAEQQRAQLATELSDVLGMVLVYARRRGIDLEPALAAKWLHYEDFHRDRGFLPREPDAPED